LLIFGGATKLDHPAATNKTKWFWIRICNFLIFAKIGDSTENNGKKWRSCGFDGSAVEFRITKF